MKVVTIGCVMFALVATPALAQNQGAMPGMNMPGMSNMGKMTGMHMMPATVTAIDARSGIVDVMAGSMSLKLHYPPSSLADVKTGDKITLHLSFSKP